MKRKFGAVVMAGVMACSMAACLSGCSFGAKADFVMPEGGFDTTKNVTITFYHQMGSDLRDILDKYIVEFNKLYPNITVEHEAQGDWDGLFEKIGTELNGGTQPNIAFCYPDHVAFYNRSKQVQVLDDFLADGAYKDYKITRADGTEENLALTQEQQDMYNPNYFKEGYEFGDGTKMYTLPWIKSTEMMFYNADFFRTNGFSVPRTWDEMETLCAAIKQRSPTSTPFGYDSAENWFITMCEQLNTPYTSATGEHFLFNDARNKAFVQRIANWKTAGYCTTQSLAKTYTSDLLLDGRAYMSIGSTGGATYNTDLGGEEPPFEVGIAPVPQATLDTSEDHHNSKLISQGPSVCIFKSDDPQEVLASWLFVKFFTTNPEYQYLVAESNGYMPVLKNEVMNTLDAYKDWIALADGANYLTAQAVKVGMEYEKAYFVSPAFEGSSSARTQVGLILDNVMTGTSIDDAFQIALDYCIAHHKARD